VKLTDKEIADAYAVAANQNLRPQDKVMVFAVSRAIEGAVLAKLADKLLDADRCSWLLAHAYVAACFTDNGVILEIAGTDRTVPARATQGQIGVKPYTAREGIDAAMLASKAVKPLPQDCVLLAANSFPPQN
jgi:hypothetical protein